MLLKLAPAGEVGVPVLLLPNAPAELLLPRVAAAAVGAGSDRGEGKFPSVASVPLLLLPELLMYGLSPAALAGNTALLLLRTPGVLLDRLPAAELLPVEGAGAEALLLLLYGFSPEPAPRPPARMLLLVPVSTEPGNAVLGVGRLLLLLAEGTPDGAVPDASGLLVLDAADGGETPVGLEDGEVGLDPGTAAVLLLLPVISGASSKPPAVLLTCSEPGELPTGLGTVKFEASGDDCVNTGLTALLLLLLGAVPMGDPGTATAVALPLLLLLVKPASGELNSVLF